jgi:hypothetical protein
VLGIAEIGGGNWRDDDDQSMDMPEGVKTRRRRIRDENEGDWIFLNGRNKYHDG